MKISNFSMAIALASMAGGTWAQTPPSTAAPEARPGTANPLPATSPVEGTAADRTPPGATPVRGTGANVAPGGPTASGASVTMPQQHRASRLIGRPVRSSSGKSLGLVRDVLI